jgi:hypothetical protein
MRALSYGALLLALAVCTSACDRAADDGKAASAQTGPAGSSSASTNDAAPVGSSARPRDAAEVLARHVKAVGGADRWNTAPARTVRAKLELVPGPDAPAGATPVTGTTEMVRVAPNRFLNTIQLDALGQPLRQGYDGQRGWMVVPRTGMRDLTEKEVAETLRQGRFNWALDIGEGYGTPELKGEFTFDGAPCWQVRMVGADGAVANAFFDQATGLCRGIASTMIGPAAGAGGTMQVVRTFKDYRDYDGIRLPSRVEVSLGANTQVETILEVSEAPVDSSLFAKPTGDPR